MSGTGYLLSRKMNAPERLTHDSCKYELNSLYIQTHLILTTILLLHPPAFSR